jgi:hypothetical protein
MVYMPDLERVRSLDDFIRALRRAKVAAGNPSISQITKRVHETWRRAGRSESEWPARSTVGNCFALGRRRPNPDLLMAVVQAITGDDGSKLDTWRQALEVALGDTDEVVSSHVRPGLPMDPCGSAVGRDMLIDSAWRFFDAPDASRPAVLTLKGMAGVGKTTVAAVLANQLVDRGVICGPVLHADLRGSDPEYPAAEPSMVLAEMLRYLGVAENRIPADLEGRARLYRQLIVKANALVLLDDVSSDDQVSLLLPDGPGCAVIVTSRHRLQALAGTEVVTVPPLDETHALVHLRRIAGAPRINADLRSARHLARATGGLPLALSILGRHMRAHPNWEIADYVHSLFPLVLEGGARLALATTDHELSHEARRLLRLLALHGGPEVDADVAVAVSDRPATTTHDHLTALADAHLLERRDAHRFVLHPVVRAYARERLLLDEPASHIRRALDRLRRSAGRASIRQARVSLPDRTRGLPPRAAALT